MLQNRELCFAYMLLMHLGCGPLAETPDVPVIPSQSDVSIVDVKLLDPESLVQHLGDEIKSRQEGDGHIAHFYNQTGDEILTLVAQKTEAGMSVRHFWVTRVDKKGLIRYPWLKEITHFTSGKGVRIGLNSDEVKGILGEPDKKNQDDESIEEWIFEINDSDPSPFLKYYKQSRYYGKYTFVNGKLKWFEFGFGPRSKIEN